MREYKLIHFLKKRERPVSKKELLSYMQLSESTVRKLISGMNTVSDNGVKIVYQSGKGYSLDIYDEKAFSAFIQKEENTSDVYNFDDRVDVLLYYLLQSRNYMTVQELMVRTGLSRSTILKVQKHLDARLSEFHLRLVSKAHFGLRVEGDEKNIRKAFLHYVLYSPLSLIPTKEYKAFEESFPEKELREKVLDSLSKYQLIIDQNILDSLMTYIRLLVFRVSLQNIVCSEQSTGREEVVFQNIAADIGKWIRSQTNIVLPQEEINYLATIFGAKTKMAKMDTVRKQQMLEDVKTIAKELDVEFLTDYSHDEELLEALTIHMFPLLNRLCNNLQLSNPLIDQIYVEYAGAFVVACRFAEIAEQKWGFQLNRDETGFLAIHFAAHRERMKKCSIEAVRRVVLICGTGGGSAQLLRLKLETLFPNALITAAAPPNVSDYREELPDLFLSTVSFAKNYESIPVIRINELPDENEMQKIRDLAALHLQKGELSSYSLQIRPLFSECYFSRVKGGSYLELIKKQAEKMILQGDAQTDFLENVLERERRYTTVYANGVAAPHSMQLNANRDTVGVTILENPCSHMGKEVQFIFLINLKQGHLFLHTEISRFLLKVINSEDIRKRMIGCDSFEDFMFLISSLL